MVKLSIVVDDLVLLSLSAHENHKLLSGCEQYASENRMRFNENQSVVFNFKRYQFKANTSATVYLNGSNMKTETLYKNLGHIINNKSDVKCRNTPGCLDQYTCKVLRVWNSRDRETV